MRTYTGNIVINHSDPPDDLNVIDLFGLGDSGGNGEKDQNEEESIQDSNLSVDILEGVIDADTSSAGGERETVRNSVSTNNSRLDMKQKLPENAIIFML